ncbi:hypothetical protein Pcac1_g13736 [Phytophthora cactorum]|nr:hypothetical protein Pcac1_g13736 [Phytophthora cactorum]
MGTSVCTCGQYWGDRTADESSAGMFHEGCNSEGLLVPVKNAGPGSVTAPAPRRAPHLQTDDAGPQHREAASPGAQLRQRQRPSIEQKVCI